MDKETRDDEVDCSDVVREVYLFLDGQLSPEEQAHVRRHLEACSPCFEAFDFEAELRLFISRRCRDEVPGSLWERVANQIGAGFPSPFPPPSLPGEATKPPGLTSPPAFPPSTPGWGDDPSPPLR